MYRFQLDINDNLVESYIEYFDNWCFMCKMPINTYWNYTSNLFIAYLELANKIRDIIMEQYVEKQVKVKEYVEEIKQTYEKVKQ